MIVEYFLLVIVEIGSAKFFLGFGVDLKYVPIIMRGCLGIVLRRVVTHSMLSEKERTS